MLRQVSSQGDAFGIRVPLLHVQSEEGTRNVVWLLHNSENQPRVQMGEIFQPVSAALKTLKAPCLLVQSSQVHLLFPMAITPKT